MIRTYKIFTQSFTYEKNIVYSLLPAWEIHLTFKVEKTLLATIFKVEFILFYCCVLRTQICFFQVDL